MFNNNKCYKTKITILIYNAYKIITLVSLIKKNNYMLILMRQIIFIKKLFYLLLFFILLFSCSNNDSINTSDNSPIINIDDTSEDSFSPINLNLRVQIMKDIIMIHSTTGVCMDSWVTTNNVKGIIIPEVNTIWKQAGITWIIESIIEEDVVKYTDYESSLNFIVNSDRNSDGNSDPARLSHLFSLMQLEYMSKANELGKNLFHIYLFPFIGNTSQGNAMSGFNYHTVVGTWTNKHNGGGVPEKTILTENQSAFEKGSLSRTISHELGHVLNLSHNECDYRCLMGGTNSDGYTLTNGQKIKSRIEAFNRMYN